MMPLLSRPEPAVRRLLRPSLLAAACALMLSGGVMSWGATPALAANDAQATDKKSRNAAQDVPKVDPQVILNDPLSPTAGNPEGDVTIVAFFDYNCPYCKKADPVIEELVKKDGRIRLIYKDLPILSEASVYGAQLAIGAQYQGKYEVAKKALMSISGGNVSAEAMKKAVAASGVDMERLDRDLKEHGGEVMAYMRRTLGQAQALGLEGTPVFLIGPYKVAAVLDYDGYAEVVADARGRTTDGE